MAESDAEDAMFLQVEYTIDPDMIWATRIDNDQVRVYLNQDETLTFTNEAAMQILRALIKVLETEGDK